MPTPPLDYSGYWSFDNYSSTTVFDASPNHFDAAYTAGDSSQNSVNGAFGKSLKTTQTNYARAAGDALTDGPFTVTSWFKHDAELVSDQPTPWVGGLGKAYRMRLGWMGGGTDFYQGGWMCKINSGNAPSVYQVYPVKAGVWYNVACTWDGSSIKLYVNGSLVRSDSYASQSYVGSEQFDFGRSSDTYWVGSIDEVRVYRRALSESELLTMSPDWAKKRQTETPKSTYSFTDSIGVNMHDWPNYESAIAPRVRELGVKHLRDNLWFINKSAWTQTKMRQHIGDGVKYALIPDQFMLNATDVVPYLKFLYGNLSGQYGNSFIDVVEGPNEPDNFYDNVPNILQKTFDYHTSMYAAIKADSQTQAIKVAAPSLTLSHDRSAFDDYNYAPIADYANGHFYQEPLNPGYPLIDKSEYYVKGEAPGLPVLVTEAGYTTYSGGFSETLQSKYLVRTLLEYFNRGYPRTYLYDFANDGPSGDDQYHSRFGLVTWDAVPKPSFYAIKNLITILSDTSTPITPHALDYELETTSADLHHLLLQKTNGDWYLVLWLERKSTDTDVTAQVTIRTYTPVTQAQLFEPHVSASATQTFANPAVITLNVPDKAVIVKLTPA
jgi:hypothetical protein